MGNNYYARYGLCLHCSRYEEIHIGKSSAGWQFMFHATEEIKSYKDWLKFLSRKGTKIYDEYNKEVSLEEFKKLIAEKQKPIYDNHAEMYKDMGSYLDDEGYSMSPYEFS